MGNTHQDKWVDQLPWTMLSRRVAVHSDIGASPSELVFGKVPTIPGEIIKDQDSSTNLRDLLTNVQKKTALPAVQTSTHSPPPSAPDASLPEGTTHVMVKQHKTLGLDPTWDGPFPVIEKISRSQIRIKIGLSKEGNIRSEVRRLHDVKPANMAEGAPDAERPRRGRKPRLPPPEPTTKLTSEADNENNSTGVNKQEDPPNSNESMESHTSPTTRPKRASRNQNPQYIDAKAIQPNRRYVGL